MYEALGLSMYSQFGPVALENVQAVDKRKICHSEKFRNREVAKAKTAISHGPNWVLGHLKTNARSHWSSTLANVCGVMLAQTAPNPRRRGWWPSLVPPSVGCRLVDVLVLQT